MKASLLPFTKLTLIVTAIVQLVMAVAGFLAPALAASLLAPGGGWTQMATQYIAGFYLAGAVTSLYALRQDNWIAARTYLLNAGIFVALAVVVTLINAGEGLQIIAYPYLVLSVIYIPVIGYVWRQESKRNA
jgi:membrane-associated HD superfamily phosphohydrolase